MKVLIATLLIVVILVLGSFMLNKYLFKSCDLLLEQTQLIYESLKDEDWVVAEQGIEKLQNEWDVNKKRWRLFLEHYRMHEVDIAVARLGQYIEIEDRADSLGEIAEIRLLIEHIKEQEAFKLGNVF